MWYWSHRRRRDLCGASQTCGLQARTGGGVYGAHTQRYTTQDTRGGTGGYTHRAGVGTMRTRKGTSTWLRRALRSPWGGGLVTANRIVPVAMPSYSAAAARTDMASARCPDHGQSTSEYSNATSSCLPPSLVASNTGGASREPVGKSEMRKLQGNYRAFTTAWVQPPSWAGRQLHMQPMHLPSGWHTSLMT